MPEFCHRCGGALSAESGESPFCPQCGAPQLGLAPECLSLEASAEPADGAGVAATTGRAEAAAGQRQVEWKTAILCAAAVAGVGSALMLAAMRVDVLSPVSLLWIMSASLITMGFYQKRRPAARMDVGVGARIGVVVGICLAVELGTAMAGAGLVARYGMHSMGGFDAQMAAQVVQVEKTIQQRAAAQSTPVPADMVGFMRTPEFRGGIMLASFAMLSAILLVLSTLGGAFAGLLRMRRRPMV